jgi:hypothetical protein
MASGQGGSRDWPVSTSECLVIQEQPERAQVRHDDLSVMWIRKRYAVSEDLPIRMDEVIADRHTPFITS